MADADRAGGGFLARWSRRKLQVSGGVEPLEEARTDPDARELEDSGDIDADLLTDSDMPPLESLNAGSDYSGFLSRGVSETLRRKALAKLFHSPVFNLVDGLDDYAEDFSSFAPLGDIITADMRHRIEVAAKRALEKEQRDTEEAASGTVAGDRADDTGPAPVVPHESRCGPEQGVAEEGVASGAQTGAAPALPAGRRRQPSEVGEEPGGHPAPVIRVEVADLDEDPTEAEHEAV